MEYAMMAAMMAAQAAAAAAAASKNSERKDQLQSNGPPIQTPSIDTKQPQASTAPQQSMSPELQPTAQSSPEPVAEIPSPEPVAAPVAAPVETATTPVEEMPNLAEGPGYGVPDRIPDTRSKLGYDETNPTAKSAASGQGAAPTTPGGAYGSLSKGGDLSKNADLADPNTTKERWAKNVTKADPADGGADGGAAGANGGSAAGSNGEGEDKDKSGNSMIDMLNNLMGKNPEGGAVAGAHGSDIDFGGNGGGGNGAKVRGGKETIFEYATFRFRQLTDSGAIKKDGRRSKFAIRNTASVQASADNVLSVSGRSSR